MAIRRFKLSESFLEQYKTQVVPWGYDGFGYIVYKRTYARRLDEQDPGAVGTEEWWQTCQRVIEGMFSIQKKHVQELGLEWNDAKAQRTAKDAYERLFTMKWTPPGRGLWVMGSDFVETRGGSALYNCAVRSTKDLANQGGYIFQWIMDALMLGIGVGIDTRGAGSLVIREPGSVKRPSNYLTDHVKDHINRWAEDPGAQPICIVADSREGWVQSVRILLDCFYQGYALPAFDYSLIRAAGEPIRGFGGTSSGPGSLKDLHQSLIELYTPAVGQPITSVQIVDTENFIGKCVVAGNVRRSACLVLGEADDIPYLTMKNDQEALRSHRWNSNNSFNAPIGMDYSWHAKQCQVNGEPGIEWLENARQYGRMADGIRTDDQAVIGTNPCGEIFLEDAELCNVPETYPARHESVEDYLQTLKIAYLYGKTVALTRTHWPETNAVMQKNRRLGISQAGVVQAINKHGYRTLMGWNNRGYKYIQELDKKYSDWLCVPRSKRLTSMKPGGSVPLLSGSTPGLHFPEDQFYIRRIRIAEDSPLLLELLKAGYSGEPDVASPNTWVVEFPIQEPDFIRGKRDVSMWEQLSLAAAYQHYWADNSVSVTVTFKAEEAQDIRHALELYEDKLKAVSFLRYEETGYTQAPYEPISETRYWEMKARVKPIQSLVTDEQGVGTSGCDSSGCAVSWG